jgi:hypothetical protein
MINRKRPHIRSSSPSRLETSLRNQNSPGAHCKHTNSGQHLAFHRTSLAAVISISEQQIVIIHALLGEPFNRLLAMFFAPAGAKNDLNARSIEEIAQAHHRMNGFILRHPLKERVPVLWFFLHMMNPLRDICQCAIDIKNDEFLCHESLPNAHNIRHCEEP